MESVQKAFDALSEFNKQVIDRTRVEQELKALKEEQFE